MLPPFSLTDPFSQAAWEAGQNAGAYSLSQNFAYTLLGSSITGASLILIIYTIVSPKLWEKIKDKRLQKEKELFTYVETCLHGMRKRKSELSSKDKEELVEKATALKEYSITPFYLRKRPGIFIFSCYILSAIMILLWEQKILYKLANLTPLIFLFGTIGFFIAGVTLIRDITDLVKEKYKEEKK